jgi:hypothetical protein
MACVLSRVMRRPSEAGQATIEFALILPVMLLLILAMLDFGKAFNYWIDETHLANEAVRSAVVNQLPDGTASDPNCGATQTIECQIRYQANTNELSGGGSSISSPLAITFCLPGGTGDVGDPLRAKAQATFRWLGFLTGSYGIPGLTAKTITVTATMRLESRYDGTNPYSASPTC